MSVFMSKTLEGGSKAASGSIVPSANGREVKIELDFMPSKIMFMKVMRNTQGISNFFYDVENDWIYSMSGNIDWGDGDVSQSTYSGKASTGVDIKGSVIESGGIFTVTVNHSGGSDMYFTKNYTYHWIAIQ